MLATAHHETDRTMQPIHEYGSKARLKKLYDIQGERPQTAASFGNTTPGDGVKYCGRGFVQLTWKNNYAAMCEPTGVDLVADPDRAMETPVAAKVMFFGMTTGAFTGKKLADYFSKTKADWVSARRIINGTDKANLIAGYGQQYYAAISYTT
jgi:predicted chitinase